MSRNKIVLLGTTHAGKTSIVQRYINGQFSTSTCASTQAAYFKKTLEIKGKKITLDIWDTAGQERFRSLAPVYYRDAACAIVVYDITDANSFTNAKQWINEVKSAIGDDLIIVLVGNKYDLQFIRVVQASEASHYAKHVGALYFEASAKSGMNINMIFNEIAMMIQQNPNVSRYDVSNESKGKKGCC